MSGANKNREINTGAGSQDDLEEDFDALFGDAVEPLRGKGAAFVAKSAQLTPGVLARRQAAQLEVQDEGNFLDPNSIIEQVAALDRKSVV